MHDLNRDAGNPAQFRIARLRALSSLTLLLVAALLIQGCASSSPETGSGGSVTPPEGARAGEEAARDQPDLPAGKFTVQLGAYQSEEGAREVATLAKSRFSREVYTVRDQADGLYKVMLGAFDTKDLARAFRDTIVRQYPQEYRDAWVSALGQ